MPLESLHVNPVAGVPGLCGYPRIPNPRGFYSSSLRRRNIQCISTAGRENIVLTLPGSSTAKWGKENVSPFPMWESPEAEEKKPSRPGAVNGSTFLLEPRRRTDESDGSGERKRPVHGTFGKSCLRSAGKKFRWNGSPWVRNTPPPPGIGSIRTRPSRTEWAVSPEPSVSRISSRPAIRTLPDLSEKRFRRREERLAGKNE
jgi:hypothetical protein